jgi:cytochrome P450
MLTVITGPVVRTAPNHLSFNTPEAIKDAYGFSKANQPNCFKDPEFFLESIYGSWNIINECRKDEHARMRKMLSHAFSTKALVEQESVIATCVNDFLYQIGSIKAEDGTRGVNITKWFNNVTFNIMGGLAFGDSFGARVGNYGPKSCLFPSRF